MKTMSFVSVLVLLMRCASAGAGTATPAASTDFLAANMDRTADPAKDFFQYANGGWLKRNPMPASESFWGVSNVVQEQLYVGLRKINEHAAGATQAARLAAAQRRAGAHRRRPDHPMMRSISPSRCSRSK